LTYVYLKQLKIHGKHETLTVYLIKGNIMLKVVMAAIHMRHKKYVGSEKINGFDGIMSDGTLFYAYGQSGLPGF
jgi:hypothetical protein